MDMDKVRRYRDLRAAAKVSKAEAEALNAEADKLERELLEAYSEDGVQNIRVDGSVVYLERKIYAAKEKDPETGETLDTDVVVAALRAAGLEHFVTTGYNSNTVSAYLRDLDENEEQLPPALVGVVRPVEVFKLKHRKAGASRH